MKFFVMIYAYRDLELDKTIKNLFEMADSPDNIRVGVINADDVPYVFTGKQAVDVKNVNYKKYHGCGRACYEILTELYKGEDYIVKIDPHTRFAKGWDTYYSQFINPDRVIVSRCLGYDEQGNLGKEETAYSRPIGFHDVQVIELSGTQYDGIEKEVFFFNAGFFIAPAAWVKDVGYDPHIAMWGEEADLSCRTFLKGYKMINVPSKVYHLYGRKNRKSVDTTAEFERLNIFGISRAKLKLGLLSKRPDLMKEWDKFGCDGAAYKTKMEQEFMKKEDTKPAAIVNPLPQPAHIFPVVSVICNRCKTVNRIMAGRKEACSFCNTTLEGK